MVLWFQGWVRFCLLALITLSNFSSVFKNKVSKSKLKLFSLRLTSFVHIYAFKVEQYLYKVVYFFGTPGINQYFHILWFLKPVSTVVKSKLVISAHH